MLKKTKIQIAVGLVVGVFLIGTFFYFQKSSGNKKVELDLKQNSEEQKIIKESVDGQSEVVSVPGEVESLPEEVNESTSSQSKEVELVPVVAEKPVVTSDDAPKVTKLSITNRLVSFGFQKSDSRKIDTIIIHSSYDAIGDDPYSVSGVIAEYKSYGVSPHYLIDRKGNIYRLVEDKNIAYHAGESKMSDGRTGVNIFSIGIEMLTTKKEKLTDAQYSALKLLIANLKGKYKITAVLGHNEIAPGRKDDPWNFEWGKIK
ncbi:MAG: N-acetylmuramoyl-L-alanine amidase [Candidatus Moraniibacteriota bacterium]